MQLTIAKLLIIKGKVFVNYLCWKKLCFLEKKQIIMVYVILEV